MKMRRLTLALAIGLLTTSCVGGSSAEPEIQDYFNRVEAAADRYNQRLDEAETVSEAGLDQTADDATFDAALVAALKQLYADGVVITTDFVNDLDAIEPPSQAVDKHTEAVTIGRQLVEALEELDLSGINQLEALQTAVGESRAAELIVDFDRTCIVLESLAVENNASVELNCGG
ncbi:MAG: hypothetical protein HKN93_04950 [Acidimicrobiia bacterium]|nr:hypothetical protein [Acidimicrobiia bacterium]